MSRRSFIGFLALMFVARVHAITAEAYDPDEFEHLQAGLMFANGDVPYRDFFEHHGPLTYLIGWLPAKLWGATTDLLSVNRTLSLAFVVVTCWAVYRLAVTVAGARLAPWSLVWLATLPWFADKSLEWRPDVPAMAFIAPAALAAANRKAIVCGLLVGLATLCTQKSGALGLGIAVALLLHADSWKRSALHFLFGFLTPWLVAAGAFASVGGLTAFLRCLFYIPAVWPMKVYVAWELFKIALVAGPASLAVGFAAWIACWLRAIDSPVAKAIDQDQPPSTASGEGAAERREGALAQRPCHRLNPDPLPARNEPPSPATGEGCLSWDAVRLPILFHWLAWPFTPAAYLQFHLLGLPLLAVATAGLLTRWINHSEPEAQARDSSSYPSLALRAQIVMLLALAPNLVWFYMHLFILPNSAPVTRTMQIAAIHRLGEEVPIASRVQDGFTGIGCLHRRADYWWWINEHSLKLLERLDELKRFRARMKSDPPAALLLDADLRRALEPLERDIERDYEVVERNDALKYFLLVKKR